MIEISFQIPSNADGLQLQGQAWLPGETPRAIVQISHGLAEHCRRYARFAEALSQAGFATYAHDHRGHGKSLFGKADYGHTGEAGWPGLVSDLTQITDHIKAQHPGIPLFLFGHSMGSFAAQQAMTERSKVLAGVVLSGSTDIGTVLDLIAASGEVPSFDDYNAAFAPNRTAFDWLSRDEIEVDMYIEDSACGFDAPEDFAASMMMHAGAATQPESLAKIRKGLPLLILSGDADPLNGGLSLLEILITRYKEAGLSEVNSKFYKDGRHEMLNETNRAEVMADLIAWFEAAL